MYLLRSLSPLSSPQASRMRFLLSILFLPVLLVANVDVSRSQDLLELPVESQPTEQTSERDESPGAPQDSIESQPSNLQVIASPSADGVILRWAPTTPQAWHFANTTGYIVERFSVEDALTDVLRQRADELDSLLTPRSLSTGENRRTIDGQILGELLFSGDLANQDSADVRQRLLDAGILPDDVDQVMSMLSEQDRADDTIDRMIDDLFASGYQRIVSEPLRPWSPEEWGAQIDSTVAEDRYAAVAAQMLHGESVIPTGGGAFERMKAQTSEYDNRYGFSILVADLNIKAARGLALRYTDNTARPTETSYTYRVYPAQQPDGFAIDTAYVTVDPSDIAPPLPPLGVRTRVTQNHVSLRWPKSALGTSYTAFYVERADGIKGKLYTDETDFSSLNPESFEDEDFQRLTRLPYLTMKNQSLPSEFASFADTLAAPTKDYTYRVYGITPFGTLSLPAQAVARGQDLVPPPAPSITENEQVEGSTVRLSWAMDITPPDLEGFEIGISRDPEGPFETDTTRALLPASTRTATDSRAISNRNNFYVVTAVDTAGNRTPSTSRYVHLVDSIPPPPPVNLSASADSNGIVTVTWDRGDVPDLMGYHIRQAHDPEDEPALETGEPLLDTVYVDTLKIRSLTKESYYDVIALDQNSNQSDASRVRVRLPDVVPPTAPVIRSARPTSESVELAWTASVSEDVALHWVMRQAETDSMWSEHAELSGTGDTYTDTSVVQGQTYAYMVVAEDSAGLRSEGGRPVTARPYDTGIRPGVEALEVEAEDGDVRLNWAYPNAVDGSYWFIVYRAQGEGDLRRYLTSEELTFADPSTNAEDAYRYAVQVMYEDGGQSRLSDVVEVTRR